MKRMCWNRSHWQEDGSFATYLQDAYNVASIHALDGEMLHEISLPGIGSLEGISGKMKDNTAFYSFSSFNYPATIFKYNVCGKRL